MKDNLEKETVEQSRHLFIYGKESIERDELISKLVEDYPPIIGENKPIAIEIKEFGLPNTKINVDKTNIYKLSIISSEYLYLNILSSIIKSIQENNDLDLIEKNFNNFIKHINVYSKSSRINDFFSLNEIMEKANKDMSYYKKFICTDMEEDIYSVINLSIFDIDYIIRKIKNGLENDKHFALIFNNKNINRYSLYSIKAINQLIGSRINDNISIKVVTDPRFWDTSTDLNGNYIQSSHDYGDLSLDESLDDYLEHNKKILKIGN